MTASAARDAVDRQLRAIREVLESGRFNYLNGGQGKRFELEFAERFGARYAIACNSGTSALYTALLALDLPAGFEVLTTPATFVSTLHAILLAGGIPRLVDVEADAPTLDPAAVRAALTPRTRVLLPVHLYGFPCRMRELRELAREHELLLIEDAAQALGSRVANQSVGTFGQAGCFSFCYTKVLTLCGEGGMVTTNDLEVARRAASIRNVGYDQTWSDTGWRTGAKGTTAGLNLRLTEIQAAVGLVELPELDAEFARRTELGERLLAALQPLGFRPFAIPVDVVPVWQALPVWLPAERFPDGPNALLRRLKLAGIPADGPYATPMNAFPFFADFVRRQGLPPDWITERFPNFERQSRGSIVFKLPRDVTWPAWEEHLRALARIVDEFPGSSP